MNSAGSDQDLGEELGRVIGHTVDGAVDLAPQRPPVASIATRAEAKAKARRARRATGSIAASVALFVGVAIGWNSLGDDSGSGTVAASDRAAAEEQVPADTQEAAAAEPDWVPPRPEDVSTGPVLDWDAVASPPVSGWGMQATDDGRIVGTAWDDLGEYQQLLVTADGLDWLPLGTPQLSGISVSVTGDTWVIVGTPAGADFDVREIYTSIDAGVSWQRLPFEPGLNAEVGSPNIFQSSSVDVAVALGGVVVASVHRFADMDINALLFDRGLLENDDVICGYDVGGGTLTVELPCTFDGLTDGSGREATVSYSYEELLLTADEIRVLERAGQDTTEIYRSDGGQFELVHTIDGFGPALVATESRFFLTGFANERVLLTSVDGRTWTDVPSVDNFFDALSVRGDEAWYSSWQADGGFALEQAVGAEPWSQIASFDGLNPFGPVQAGPGGLMLVAQPWPPILDGEFGVEDGAFTAETVPDGLGPDEAYFQGPPETWVGWSADGIDWGWQRSLDAFGIEGESGVNVAVGDGFALAAIDEYPLPPEATNGEPEPFFEEPITRWFLAEVPPSG